MENIGKPLQPHLGFSPTKKLISTAAESILPPQAFCTVFTVNYDGVPIPAYSPLSVFASDYLGEAAR